MHEAMSIERRYRRHLGIDLKRTIVELKRRPDSYFYTTKSEGMGIGLWVSRSIVEKHHGRLWAESNDGPGATFAFSIPIDTETGATQCPL
jgi:signal transduction histidine kinase